MSPSPTLSRTFTEKTSQEPCSLKQLLKGQKRLSTSRLSELSTLYKLSTASFNREHNYLLGGPGRLSTTRLSQLSATLCKLPMLSQLSTGFLQHSLHTLSATLYKLSAKYLNIYQQGHTAPSAYSLITALSKLTRGPPGRSSLRTGTLSIPSAMALSTTAFSLLSLSPSHALTVS